MSRFNLRAACLLGFSVSGLHGSGVAAAPTLQSALPQIERVMVTTPPRPIADFELTNDAGRPVRLSSLKGQPLMLYFGYTHCPDVCPTALGQLMSLKKADPAGYALLRVVFVSIDGDRDDPAAVRVYLNHFSSEFIGLTGTPAEVREVARQFAATVFKGKPQAGAAGYLVEHTNRIYAIDREGRLRAELYDAPLESMRQVAQILLSEAS